MDAEPAFTGLNLWNAWPAMTQEQRMAALEGIWQRHVALQGTSVVLLAGLHLPSPRRYRFEHDAAARQLRGLVEAGVLEESLAPGIWQLVERGLEAVQAVPWRLVHGDPSFTNTQCHNNIVIGLIDLEAACVAPVDLDLDLLLRMLAAPLDDPDPLARMVCLTRLHSSAPSSDL